MGLLNIKIIRKRIIWSCISSTFKKR